MKFLWMQELRRGVCFWTTLGKVEREVHSLGPDPSSASCQLAHVLTSPSLFFFAYKMWTVMMVPHSITGVSSEGQGKQRT